MLESLLFFLFVLDVFLLIKMRNTSFGLVSMMAVGSPLYTSRMQPQLTKYDQYNLR